MIVLFTHFTTVLWSWPQGNYDMADASLHFAVHNYVHVEMPSYLARLPPAATPAGFMRATKHSLKHLYSGAICMQ